MNRSESIVNLAPALALAQGVFPAVTKGGKNPHLGSKYATLDDVIGAIRAPLKDHGLSFVQPLRSEGDRFILETILLHESGEWLSCEATIPPAGDNRGVSAIQMFGGTLTYMRRYMLTSLLGINSEDDADGNGTDGKKPAAKAAPPKPAAKAAPPTPTAARTAMHEAMADAIAPHWITDDKVRAEFWSWASKKALNEVDIHTALGVEHIVEFTGTVGDAKTMIMEWVKAQSEASPPAE